MTNQQGDRIVPGARAVVATVVIIAVVAILAVAALVRRSGIELWSAAPVTLTPVAMNVGDADPQRWFFAEGASMPPFRTSYALLNPGAEAADVNITLYPETGQRAQRMVRVAPGTQVRVPGESIIPNAAFGAEIYSTQPIYVERLTTGVRDGTTSTGLQRSSVWYFPDAQAGGDYDARLVILNPAEAAATVTVLFLPSGAQRIQQTFDISAGSRSSILISQYVAVGTLAIMVNSSAPIVAEQVTYYDAGNAMYGGPGVTFAQLSKTWYVPLANTQTGFSARVAVFNPGDSPANVRLTVIENKVRKTVPFDAVPAHGKRDFNVNNISAGLRVAVEVVSDQKIAVQTTGAYMSNREDRAVAAYSSLAVPAPARVWYFPESAGDDDYDSYLSIFNPLENTARARVTYVIEGEQALIKEYRVGTRERLTMAVRDEVNGANASGKIRRVVAVIISSDRPLVADRLTMFRRSVGASASAGIAGR